MKETMAILAMSAVAAVTLTGCGGGGSGGSKVSADKWVGSFCGDLKSYTKTASQTPDLASSAGSGDLTGTKQKLSDYLATGIKATDTLSAQLKKDGTPDVDKGDQIVAKLQGSLKKLSSTYAADKKKIDAADPSDKSGFANALTTVGKDISAASASAGKDLDSVSKSGTGDLQKAYDKNATCKQLNG